MAFGDNERSASVTSSPVRVSHTVKKRAGNEATATGPRPTRTHTLAASVGNESASETYPSRASSQCVALALSSVSPTPWWVWGGGVWRQLNIRKTSLVSHTRRFAKNTSRCSKSTAAQEGTEHACSPCQPVRTGRSTTLHAPSGRLVVSRRRMLVLTTPVARARALV